MEQAPLKQAFAVIYRSPNGRDGWQPVKWEEVPTWVKEPKNMARLVAGEACMKCDEGETGSDWFRAEVINPDVSADVKALRKAKAKRERRNARRKDLH